MELAGRLNFTALPHNGWPRLASLFAILPLAAGIVFRTYQNEVDPLAFELVRQLDLLFLLIEIVVIATARRHSFAYGHFFRALPLDVRWAAIVFLATFWIGSVFVTHLTPYSIIRAALWPVHLVFGASLWHLSAGESRETLRRIVLVLIAGYVAYLPLLAAHFWLAPGPEPLRLGRVVWTSALPGYLSVRHFGIEMGVLLAMLLGTIWRDARIGGTTVLAFVAVAVVGGAVCWSGTRAAMLGVAGAIAITIVARRRLPARATAMLVLAALIVGGVLSTRFLPPDPAFGFRLMPDPSAEDFSSGRLQIWKDAADLILARPLTGWGEGSFIWLRAADKMAYAHPHNVVLQMLQSWGVPGALAVLYLIARLWLEMNRRGRDNAWLLPALMAFDALLVMSMVDGILFHARMIMLVAFVAVIALARPAHQRPCDPQRQTSSE